MIKNFEEITAELTAVEVELMEIVKEHLVQRGPNKRTKTFELQQLVNDYCELHNVSYKLHDSRLRKMIGVLRQSGTLPIIATSKGYFVSYDKQTISDQIDSLCQRANSIASSATGLQSFL